MARSPLAVPLAVAPDGALVFPLDADPALNYTCAGCGGPLLLRRSDVKRSHFAHRRGEACSAESVLHRAGKRVVLDAVAAWRTGTGPRPCLDRRCPVWSCGGSVVQDLPDDITRAEAEVHLPDGSVADVLLYRGDEPACVVEVYATHAVDAEKAARLRLPWMELDADDLLDRPYWWVVVQDGLRPFPCPECRARVAERTREMDALQAEAVEVARRTGQALPPSPPYRFVSHGCWSCGSDMVVFLWPGGGGHSGRTPPPPRPSTVRRCATEGYGGDYWANCCPACYAVQGDAYLLRDRDYASMASLMVASLSDPAGQ